MDLLANGLLFAATVGAVVYCQVLAGRLRRLTALDSGMGRAIAVLSAQVDDMTRALHAAQGVAAGAERRLAAATGRADLAARQLELLMAALHDVSGPDSAAPGAPAAGSAAGPDAIAPAAPAPEACNAAPPACRTGHRRAASRESAA